jgi:hypothetical protein
MRRLREHWLAERDDADRWLAAHLASQEAGAKVSLERDAARAEAAELRVKGAEFARTAYAEHDKVKAEAAEAKRERDYINSQWSPTVGELHALKAEVARLRAALPAKDWIESIHLRMEEAGQCYPYSREGKLKAERLEGGVLTDLLRLLDRLARAALEEKRG